MRKFLTLPYQVLLFFAFLGVLFIPFFYHGFSFQASITQFIFQDLILFMDSCSDKIDIVNPVITSDSTALYLLCLILFVVSILLTGTLSFFTFWKKYQSKILILIQLVLVYYLATVMLKYGFDKIFKAQFYLPEPNILYTPLGMLDKDMLFWSTMGTSHLYNVFMGLIEIIPALFLLHKKTRNLGLLILSGVLMNVLMINISFDISVKLYASFLLFLSLLLLAPFVKKVFQFLLSNKPTTLAYLTGQDLITSKTVRFSIKAILIIAIFIFTLFPFIKSGQYNDDKVSRNYLHGAYEISSIEQENSSGNLKGLKRFFIHRHNYIIFQYDDETMVDFYLEIDSNLNQFNLRNYDGETIVFQYYYSENLKQLELSSLDQGWTLYARELPWRKLPALQPLFHWTVDEIE